MSEIGVYTSLFAVAFFAATILPAQSELGLVGLILSEDYALPVLIGVASAGNTLGAVVNWLIGRYVNQLQDRKWFPATPKQLEKATEWYGKYGRWSLLLSWMPIIGDPLTLAAGVLREPFLSFLVLVGIAKATRYIVVAAITLNWL